MDTLTPILFGSYKDETNPNPTLFSGFDGGLSLGGRDVWMLAPTLLDFLKDDVVRHGSSLEEWMEQLVPFETGTLYGTDETIYLVADIAVYLYDRDSNMLDDDCALEGCNQNRTWVKDEYCFKHRDMEALEPAI